MNQLGTVYATKRRRRNGKSLKPPPKDGVTKSNPSKRHRERLNAELDTLASLLPFEQNILSKLDRLSILRLSVSYLRTKSYFQVVMHKDKEDALHHDPGSFRTREMAAYDHAMLDGEMFLQALNGFLLILTCEGEVFFATHSIESYLGFHQSDIVHQSVYELVHSEDREELQRQLMWNSFLAPEGAGLVLQEVLRPEHAHLLERSFTVRFRCLLDNTSGFLRLDIRGRVKVLHGQNRKTEEPPLALFAICTPFGPPSLLEIPQKEVMFKSKHKLDLALVSMDQRGKLLLGYSDAELANLGGYDLVHYDDLAYVASAHQELLKTGASGMIAYRFQTKDGGWQWLQTSSRLVYKNSKPDFVISTHRPLMEEEGRDLLGKRTMDFKVSYLDAGLTNSYFSDSDPLVMGSSPLHHSATSPTGAGGGGNGGSGGATPQRVNRRYKTQLRDFLSTCRTKRKLAAAAVAGHPGGAAAAAGAVAAAAISNSLGAVDYISAATSDSSSAAAAAAVAAAYNMYSTPYAGSGVSAGAVSDNGLTSYMSHSPSNFHQSLYPAAALDNRFLATTENLFHQYRPLGSYYSEYHHAAATTPYVSNGFLDMSPRGTACALPTYDTSATSGATSHHHMHHQLSSKGEDKLYSCQQLVDAGAGKYASVVDGSRGYVVATSGLSSGKCLDVSAPYSVSPSAVTIQPLVMSSSPDLGVKSGGGLKSVSVKHSPSMDGLSSNSAGSSPAAGAAAAAANGLITPKLEDIKTEVGLMQASSSPPGHHLTNHHMAQGMAQHHYAASPVSTAGDAPRQTVLMWGSGGTTTLNHTGVRSPTPLDGGGGDKALANGGYGVVGSPKKYGSPPGPDPLKSLAEMNSMAPVSSSSPATTSTAVGVASACKWAGGGVVAAKSEPAPPAQAAPPPASPHPHPHAASPSLSGKGGGGGGGAAYQQQSHSTHHSVFHPPAPPPPHHPVSHHHQHLAAAYVGDATSAAATTPSSTSSSSGGAGPASTEHISQRHRLSTDKQDRSPLLSISEVTNTLLNQ